MKIVTYPVFVVLAFVAMVTCARSAGRPIDQAAIGIYPVLQKRDFSGLDRIAERLRQENELLSDGQPALVAFYKGVSACVQPKCDEEPQLDQTWVAHGKLLDEWIEAVPRSTTARLAKAAYVTAYAWHIRGTGYAHTVSPNQWKEFADRLQQARVLLQALKKEAENDPHWYAEMLAIGLAQSWPRSEMDEVFDAGVKKFPAYFPMYFYKAASLSPRWGGNQEDLARFVEEAVQATRGALGETLYARLYWSEWKADMFEKRHVDWLRMKAGFARMAKDHPDPWNLNNFAFFACLAGDVDTLAEILDQIGDATIVVAWRSPRRLAACRRMTDRPTQASGTAPSPAPRRGAPEQVLPRPGATFDDFPRITLLEWRPVPGAVSYSIEVDCYLCCETDKWCTDSSKPPISASGLQTTSYRFSWVGSNLGRWRVWAVGADGKDSPKSSWREFIYTR